MRIVALLTIATGCLSVPEPNPAMCSSNDDCGGNGEVCTDGVCYGDPPSGPFAALLSPPSARTDLVGTDIPALDIPQDGTLASLQLEAPVTFAGRVEGVCGTCDQQTIGAQISITRPARFAGGPAFQVSIASDERATANSFSISLPRQHDGDAPYQVTITPKDDATGGPSPAQLVPPTRFDLPLTDDASATYTLGGDGLVTLTGNLFDNNLQMLGDYRVYALGHWNAGDATTIVSTIDYTVTGAYSITLSQDLVDTVEIVAEPFGMAAQPTLHLPHIDLTSNSHDLVAPANMGKGAAVYVAVTGAGGDGSVGGVSGAHVFATGIVTPSGAGPNIPTHATFDADAVTDQNGLASLVLLDGTSLGDYELHIVPPADSTLAADFDQSLSVASCTDGGHPCTTQLQNRLAIHGVITDADGNPIKGMTVTAKPALSFALSLQAAPQAFLAQIPPPASVTPDSGEYVVFVDHLIGDVWGTYDLDIEPSAIAAEPHWTESGIVLPRDLGVGQVAHDIQLGAPAHIHGVITDPAGVAVPQAEVRVYAISTDNQACLTAVNPPSDCVVPAVQVAHATAGDDGDAKFTLAR